MPYVRTRRGATGEPRYAYFHDARRHERSAGTYPLLREAREAAFDAQARVLDGRFLDRAAGRSTFEHYVTETWLPNLTFEATTRQGYAYTIHKYLLEFFGPIRMSELMPGTVREFYALLSAAGLGAPTLHKCKTVLCSIFNTAVNDRIVARHPCAGVPVPPDPQRLRKVISPAQYLAIHQRLPARWQLLTDLALDSACRWGELAELRVKDLDTDHRELRVTRTVVEIDAAHRPPDYDRFLIKDYPKNTHDRILALGTDLVERLTTTIEQRGAGPQDLLFPATKVPPTQPARLPDPEDFIRGGRRFTHGTLYAYTVGACRCDPCRDAINAYRTDRRNHGLDRPTYRLPVTQTSAPRHISRDWFRNRIWQPAINRGGDRDANCALEHPPRGGSQNIGTTGHTDRALSRLARRSAYTLSALPAARVRRCLPIWMRVMSRHHLRSALLARPISEASSLCAAKTGTACRRSAGSARAWSMCVFQPAADTGAPAWDSSPNPRIQSGSALGARVLASMSPTCIAIGGTPRVRRPRVRAATCPRPRGAARTRCVLPVAPRPLPGF